MLLALIIIHDFFRKSLVVLNYRNYCDIYYELASVNSINNMSLLLYILDIKLGLIVKENNRTSD